MHDDDVAELEIPVMTRAELGARQLPLTSVSENTSRPSTHSLYRWSCNCYPRRFVIFIGWFLLSILRTIRTLKADVYQV